MVCSSKPQNQNINDHAMSWAYGNRILTSALALLKALKYLMSSILTYLLFLSVGSASRRPCRASREIRWGSSSVPVLARLLSSPLGHRPPLAVKTLPSIPRRVLLDPVCWPRAPVPSSRPPIAAHTVDRPPLPANGMLCGCPRRPHLPDALPALVSRLCPSAGTVILTVLRCCNCSN